ncbi:ROK family protein [Sporosarcina sp. E16_3]|uniref:ROK family protein n=1 Tax=Sporosarcina sp. E16_3 TaxID=2789293 RepID=UPI001A92DE6E|nr:ROK family protein [Sporosarcina sp. E16_3]
MAYALGVDIGGTKIATVLIDQNGEIYNRSEVASDPSDKEKMFTQVIKSIEKVLKDSQVHLNDIKGMGVGIPGKVDRENGIAVFQNNLPWRNFPIVSRLQDYFSIKNIVIDNDVYMATFAEWKVSNINRLDTFVYVTVSTGISCSIIHQGSFIRGNGFAGELGLFPVLAKSSVNGVDNLEKSASGPAIKKLAEKRFNNPAVTTSEFFAKYEVNDEEAKALMNEVVESLAHGIYSIICLLDPHRIVLGGGVINNNPYLVDLLKDSLKQYLIPEQQQSLERLFTSELKGDSGIIGAGLKGIE